ncbi:hypothetical protein SKAU_G00097980 [Synaphobranchus kaupii]|uniref:WxxW domain-containing protein n=1 Tax=Synaphobranchus kaupii TaxID=118154 RepID=A0A9Q1FY01_SYNKA|nr:hypothetical protein SKAU_G00097980 [Synaphobranchus kaupii]
MCLDLHAAGSVTESCRTTWFDDGDVTAQGDSELLLDLRRAHRTAICPDPLSIEAQTVSGIKSCHTKNTFHRYNVSEGFVCLNSEQRMRACEDYKVMFTCSGQFCSECRTRWFDFDDPTGNGDYEVLSELLTMYPRHICPQPIAIEAQTLSGEPASNTGDSFLIYDATYGFACVNADQISRKCKDYRVRFTCPMEFCSVPTECRTRWLSSDDPAGEGDVESIPQLLQKFPGQVCRNPISIAAQTAYGIAAEHTGNTYLSYDVIFGFVCINSDQRYGKCKNYQVMLTCPSDFCQGCRTRWFDMDNPTGRGDYETVVQLQRMHRGEICSQPIGIEATTVSGTPALQTGDTFLVYDATHGLACINTQQHGGLCQDYRVRFTCPLQFCAQKPNPK